MAIEATRFVTVCGQEAATLLVIRELQRQLDKWGPQSHPPLYWLGILGEEFGEVARALIEGNEQAAQEELTHVAAVAIAAIESMGRQHGAGTE